MSINGKYQLDPKEIRVYYKENSCVFKKNNEEFGDLSNMATKFPLHINNISVRTVEAIYQACRFPHKPEIQKKIIEQKSPMNVKMISNANKKQSRDDWDFIRLKVMKWCINIKLAQNFISFGAALHETGLRNIVEKSSKDNYWGAIPNEDETVFTGKNALGRLLMDLRQTFYSQDCYSTLYVPPPQIDNFLLYNEPIGIHDERISFINSLKEYWKALEKDSYQINSHIKTFVSEINEKTSSSKVTATNVEEGIDNNEKVSKKTKSKRKSSKAKEPSLFDDNS